MASCKHLDCILPPRGRRAGPCGEECCAGNIDGHVEACPLYAAQEA
jgi:hypothetical protein